MINRIAKFTLCLILIPFLLTITIGLIPLIILLPIIALIKPDWIKVNGGK